MEIIRSLEDIGNYKNPVVTIGNFDGVHIGHQKIFRKVVQTAGDIDGTPIAITFQPHPVRVLAPERGLKITTTFADKMKIISLTGIRVLICIPFDREFARTDPDVFIRDILVNRIGTRWVIVGHSYSFGRGKKGTTTLLRTLGRKYGFKVNVVRYATLYGDIVSSSRVRSLILRGRVCEASQALGRPYHIVGLVVRGAGRGASLLHTPTANIRTDNELIPKEGVYAVRVSFENSTQVAGIKNRPRNEETLGHDKLFVSNLWPCIPYVYDGVANVGENPTFGEGHMNYEVHIFGFDRDIIGRGIRLHFIDRIRDEKRFSGARELEDQIQKDKEKALQILRKRNDPLYL